MSTESKKLKFPEVICNDFGSVKGCGKIIVMQKLPGQFKEDGKPKWGKFNKDGSPHNHDPTKQGTTRLDDVRPPVSNPNAVMSNSMLERQFAQLAQEYDALRLRVTALENAQVKKESDAMINASEDELGEEKFE